MGGLVFGSAVAGANGIRSAFNEQKFVEYEKIDDSNAWGNHIDFTALRAENKELKAIAIKKDEEKRAQNRQKNKITGFFKMRSATTKK